MQRLALLSVAAQVYGMHLRLHRHFEGPVNYRTVYHAKDGEVPELGTQLQCCVNLALQYFFVYTALAMVSTYADLHQAKKDQARSSVVTGLRSVLTQCAQTVAAAPMLAVLFLVLEMRFRVAEKDLPSYAHPWMLAATYALGVQTLMVLCLPIVTGEIMEVEDDGTLKGQGTTYGWLARLIQVLRYSTLAVLYAGVCGCMYALFGPDAPGGGRGSPPAVHCVAMLCALYFLPGFLLVLARELGDRWIRARDAMSVTFSVASMSPMVAIVFVAARVRALQVTSDGNPQYWAQMCMYSATGALLLQAVLVLACALLGGELKSRFEGDFCVITPKRSIYIPITAVRYIAVVGMLGCIIATFVSAFLLGKGSSAAVSPAVQNTFVLASAFFAVYITLHLLYTLHEVLNDKDSRGADSIPPQWFKWIKTAENARLTIQFCPMLAVLFLAVRVRALQVTDKQGGPQYWAQFSMGVCTTSVLVQLLMVLAVALSTDRPVDANKAGVVSTQPSSPALRISLTIVRYVAFVGLYGGLIAVISSLFLIQPETASAL